MTPAVKLLEKLAIPHRVLHYEHDADAASYGLEAAEKMAQDPAQVFKTLVVSNEQNALAVVIVPVAGNADLKAAAKALKWKKSAMAAPDLVMRSTGYVLGGVSPLGQRKALPTLLDNSAERFSEIFISAGKRGLEIAIKSADLLKVCRGSYAALAKY